MDKIEYKVLTDKLNVPVGSKMVGHPAGHLLENDTNGEILTITDIERNPDWFEKVEPLFITEDGVDIYEGESCYNVDRWSLKLYGPKEYKGNSKGKLKYFSTKETAEEYIKAHKPRYSRMDIGKAIAKTKSLNKDYIINELINNIYNE